MGNLRRWSSSASGNATVTGGSNTINFAEGQPPSTVNNSAREMMAQLRGIYSPSNWGWVENSATASVVNQTSFKLTGNQTSDWTAGKRWKLRSGSTTCYGSVVSSSYTSETTVTVTVDSGSLSASHSLAALSAVDYTNVPPSVYGVSVKTFGAIGDGTTDDTTAIQAALTYAGTVKCELYFPASTYAISNNLTIPDGVSLRGDGWGSYVKQTVLNKGVFICGNSNTIRGLRTKIIDGNNTAFVSCIRATSVKNLTIEDCYIESADLGGVGIYVSAVQNSVIRNNRIYNGAWSSGAGFAASASDILLYSGAASERHLIEGNFCLSNNSQGIFVDALGYDGDIVVSNNVCVTLDPSTCTLTGTWALASTGGVRRHGIIVGYNSSSVSGPRCVVSGNICRNTRWTGIYKQGVSSGAVIISNNLCDLNGYDTSSTLSGGIYVNQSGYEAITGNIITNFQNTTQATGGITINATVAPTVPSTVSNNFIRGSLGRGIALSTNATFVEVIGNTLISNANFDIEISCTSATAAICGHNVQNNRIVRTSGTSICGILADSQSSTYPLIIKNNTIRGNDNTTVNAQNTGIYVSQATSVVQVIGNTIVKFYYGVYSPNYYASGRMLTVLYEGNVIQDCSVGFAVSGSTANHTVPLVNNQFVGTSTFTSGPLGFAVGRIVNRIGELLVWQSTAAPTVGSWAIGDRSMNSSPAAGQPKSWVCTVAGTPGTWVSEGNL